MERFSLAQCKKLIGEPNNEPMGDEDVLRLRDMLYTLGDVIADAYADLNNIDQSAFQPSSDLDVWLEEIGGGNDGQ